MTAYIYLLEPEKLKHIGWGEKHIMTNILVLTDRPELPHAQHNYNKALRWLVDNGKLKLPRGEVLHAGFFHDDWCTVYDGHLCNCRPDIVINGQCYEYPVKALGDTYEGRMTDPTGCAFHEWLMTQQDRQDGVGQLAQAIARFGLAVPTQGGYMAWMQFMRDMRGGESGRQRMRKAFDEFYEVMGV